MRPSARTQICTDATKLPLLSQAFPAPGKCYRKTDFHVLLHRPLPTSGSTVVRPSSFVLGPRGSCSRIKYSSTSSSSVVLRPVIVLVIANSALNHNQNARKVAFQVIRIFFFLWIPNCKSFRWLNWKLLKMRHTSQFYFENTNAVLCKHTQRFWIANEDNFVWLMGIKSKLLPLSTRQAI